MARHIACITFDFDAVSSFIASGLTTPTQMSRGEFGAVAVPRILALLKRFEVRATWFIPGHTIESYPTQCAAILGAGHEIGHHAIGFRRYSPRCLEEYEAWRWAIEEMERRGLNLTDRVRTRMLDSVRYAVRKAHKRGLQRLPVVIAQYLQNNHAPEAMWWRG